MTKGFYPSQVSIFDGDAELIPEGSYKIDRETLLVTDNLSEKLELIESLILNRVRELGLRLYFLTIEDDSGVEIRWSTKPIVFEDGERTKVQLSYKRIK